MTTINRIRLTNEHIAKKPKKRGRKTVIEKGIDLDLIETALRQTNGLITKAAKLLRVSIPTLQNYIKKYTSLREALFESRAEIVDEAEQSLRDLVRSKNLTAVIFTLKCLAQDRGYVDTPRKEEASKAPIVINLLPASPDVKMPSAQLIKGKKRILIEAENAVRALPKARKEEEYSEDDAETIEIESSV